MGRFDPPDPPEPDPLGWGRDAENDEAPYHAFFDSSGPLRAFCGAELADDLELDEGEDEYPPHACAACRAELERLNREDAAMAEALARDVEEDDGPPGDWQPPVRAVSDAEADLAYDAARERARRR